MLNLHRDRSTCELSKDLSKLREAYQSSCCPSPSTDRCSLLHLRSLGRQSPTCYHWCLRLCAERQQKKIGDSHRICLCFNSPYRTLQLVGLVRARNWVPPSDLLPSFPLARIAHSPGPSSQSRPNQSTSSPSIPICFSGSVLPLLRRLHSSSWIIVLPLLPASAEGHQPHV